MPTNIKDVAKEAGVSITTVSRVLNNNYPVKKETRENIEKAIEKLNYKPNVMARSLITKKTGVIGVIIPSITNLFFPTIVEAVEEYIRTKGYSITLCNTHGDNKEEKELVEKVISRQVDGIIVIDPTAENVKNGLYERLSKTIPLIIVSGSYDNSKCNYVCYDQTVGTKEAFQYLLELGHRKIAFLRGHKSYSYDIKEKIYKNILEGENIEYEKVINAGKGNSLQVVEKSEEQIKELLKNEERPTAIFSCNDLMAVGALNACRSVGLRVPQDISIIGFDNTIVSDITSPRITSVDLNMKEIGNRAALELIDVIESESKKRKTVIIDTNLVIKDSCIKVNDK